MRRQRSVSDSKSYTDKDADLSTRPRTYSTRSKLHSTSYTGSSHRATYGHFEKDSSKAALTNVLMDYKFVGKVITVKQEEEYGFLRCDQITGDIFFSLHHITLKTEAEVLGKFASFTVEDVGKKSVEARGVIIHDKEPGVKILHGVIDRWVKTGCLIQVTSGLGSQEKYSHNRIFAPYSECSSFDNSLTNVIVEFRIQLDKSLRVEARRVSLVQGATGLKNVTCSKSNVRQDTCQAGGDHVVALTAAVEEKLTIKDLSNVDCCEDLIKSVDGMNSDQLTHLFETKLKLRLSELAQQPIASKVIIAVIKKVGQLGCHKIEEKITRMIVANFFTISSCKQGCQVVQAALDNFSDAKRVMIAEQLTELGSVEEFTDLWTHGSHVFVSMLDYLDETSLGMIGTILQGNYVSLSCHIGHYKPIKALLSHLVSNDCFTEIYNEIEEHIMSLSYDKFGHYIIVGLLETAEEAFKNPIIDAINGKVVAMSLDSIAHQVIIAAVKEGDPNQQTDIIEEVCRVTDKQAEMEIIHLAQDIWGHKVVLAMLQGTRHKHIHNILKASILCKQDELLENEFAARVFKAIKTEFHNKVSGNYPNPKFH